MSISILNRGGASGGLTASIFVMGLSESDTVTASNGSKTKQGVWNSENSRHEITGIKDLGTWTVTADNGEKTKTKDVLIDVIGQYEIDLYFTMWLYRNGNQFERATGGWAQNTGVVFYSGNSANGTVVFNDDNIYFSAPSGYNSAVASTNNMIDVSFYTKLCIKAQGTNVEYLTFVMHTNVSGSITPGDQVAVAPDSTGYGEVDISEVSGSYYISGGVNNGRNAELLELWME